jgi:hypothetical protein
MAGFRLTHKCGLQTSVDDVDAAGDIWLSLDGGELIVKLAPRGVDEYPTAAERRECVFSMVGQCSLTL